MWPLLSVRGDVIQHQGLLNPPFEPADEVSCDAVVCLESRGSADPSVNIPEVESVRVYAGTYVLHRHTTADTQGWIDSRLPVEVPNFYILKIM